MTTVSPSAGVDCDLMAPVPLPPGVDHAGPWQLDDAGRPQRLLSNGAVQRADGTVDEPVTTKKKTVKKKAVTDVADLEPVNLDSVDPALAHWQELVDRDTAIYHGGDIEKIMPFPRPAWSDPDQDLFSTSLPCCLYRADPVKVSATRHTGDKTDPDEWTSAGVYVQPAIGGTDVPVVRISFSERVGGKWDNSPYMALTITEATDLIGVLRAAVDLHGGAQ